MARLAARFRSRPTRRRSSHSRPRWLKQQSPNSSRASPRRSSSSRDACSTSSSSGELPRQVHAYSECPISQRNHGEFEIGLDSVDAAPMLTSRAQTEYGADRRAGDCSDDAEDRRLFAGGETEIVALSIVSGCRANDRANRAHRNESRGPALRPLPFITAKDLDTDQVGTGEAEGFN